MRQTRQQPWLPRLVSAVLSAVLVLAAVALWPAPGAERASAAPKAGMPKPAVLDRYELDVTYDPNAATIGGVERLRFTNNTRDTLPDLWFHLFPNADEFRRDPRDGSPLSRPGALTIQEARVDGQPVTPEPESFHIRVALPRAVAPGESAQVELRFVTTIPPLEDRFGYTGNVANITSWYPILAVYDAGVWRRDDYIGFGDPFFSQVAAYRVGVTAPPGYTVAATGALSDTASDAAGTRVTYVADPVREFALAISPRFTVTEREVGGTTIRYYAAGGTGPEAAASTLDAAAEAFRIYSGLFGAYPYRDLAVVNSDSGMEYPQLVFVGNGDEFTTVHEVGHQWWYGVVGNDEVHDIWDEALTNYSSLLYYERRYGAQRFREELQRRILSYRTQSNAPRSILCVGCDLYYYRDHPGAYGAGIYRKGAAMFDALRQQVGDDAFFACLRAFYSRYQFATADWQDLIATASDAAGRDLSGFFADWLQPGGGE